MRMMFCVAKVSSRNLTVFAQKSGVEGVILNFTDLAGSHACQYGD